MNRDCVQHDHFGQRLNVGTGVMFAGNRFALKKNERCAYQA